MSETTIGAAIFFMSETAISATILKIMSETAIAATILRIMSDTVAAAVLRISFNILRGGLYNLGCFM